MIQVLRIGNYVNHSKREYKATCWRCNALLQFDHFDQFNDPIENGIYILDALSVGQCWKNGDGKKNDSSRKAWE